MDLSRITVFCFAASYVVAFALEAVALVGRRGGQLAATLSGGRRLALLGFTIAGVFAHLAYLTIRVSNEATPLSSPADWCLIVSAVLALVYLVVSLWSARWASGLFLLPIVLGLVGLANVASEQPISPERASVFWGQAHGWLLVATTASVCVGFVAGAMYLVQNWRLKHNLPPTAGLLLPSLEWLEGVSARSLALSVWLMAGGFFSGLVLTRLKQGETHSLWTDPIVITSAAMLGWLLLASGFRWVYPPARTGRKVAYLTVAAFGFLAITLASLALRGPRHGGLPTDNRQDTTIRQRITADLMAERESATAVPPRRRSTAASS